VSVGADAPPLTGDPAAATASLDRVAGVNADTADADADAARTVSVGADAPLFTDDPAAALASLV